MDKNTALNLLGLSAAAGAADLTQAYRRRVADLRLQMSDAPSTMKGIYEKNLLEVEAAFHFLTSDNADLLPSAERVSAPTASAAAPVASAAVAAAQNRGLMQTANKWLFGVTLVSLAAAAFFGMGWQGMRGKVSELVQKSSLDTLAATLESGDFKVVNRGEENVYLSDFAVAYFENGELKTYQKEYKEVILIKPGGSFEPKEIKDDRLVYPGKAFFYTLVVYSADGSTMKVLSGTHHKKELQINPVFKK